MFNLRTTGDMPAVFYNVGGLYEGDLRYYFKVIANAPNIHHGYHGLHHMLHVMWVCYQACVFYHRLGQLSPRRMRNLLIAALFHDYDHVGKGGDDKVNIRRAVYGLKRHIAAADRPYFREIAIILMATHYPHCDLGPDPLLEQLIIRDADASQVFGPEWFGHVVAGFGSELGKSPREMLEVQDRFLEGLTFYTDFGKVVFGEAAIFAKRQETIALRALLV